MNTSQRLLKRNKRQVARAKKHVKLSEPDVRTREQVEAARQATRPTGGRKNAANTSYPSTSFRNHPGAAKSGTTKTDT